MGRSSVAVWLAGLLLCSLLLSPGLENAKRSDLLAEGRPGFVEQPLQFGHRFFQRSFP